MIKSKLKLLIAQREVTDGRKITNESLAQQAGLSVNTIGRLAEGKTDRIDFSTIDKLCLYFGCNVGDLLEFVPDEKRQAANKFKRSK
ncbi:MAG: helix-turn-helix transcriptional regulator [Chloroflexi bacterium]|nr:helix-turn-helix transcriptional regulator [Chloroflexota bacterium]